VIPKREISDFPVSVIQMGVKMDNAEMQSHEYLEKGISILHDLIDVLFVLFL
jgi:hypothetical protein